MDFEKEKKSVDPFSDNNLPEGSGPSKVSKKNLQNQRRPDSKVSWLLGCIPIIIIVVLIIILQ